MAGFAGDGPVLRFAPAPLLTALLDGILEAMSEGAGPDVPVTIGVDVEPDDRAEGPGAGVRLDGFRATRDWLEGIRPLLARASGRPVAFTWFLRMDPQIAWLTGRPEGLAERLERDLAVLLARGDAVGLHTHAGRWDGSQWIADHGDERWIRECVEVAAGAYERVFGRACAEHRFGDRWTGEALYDTLLDVGVEVDGTIEPGIRGAARTDVTMPATGRIPDYLHVPREASPVRDGRLWLLPLTSADPGPSLPPLQRLARRLRYPGEPLHRPHLLDRSWSSPAACWDIAEARLAEMERPYLSFVVRSDMVLDHRAEPTDAVLRALAGRALVRRLRFLPPRGVLAAMGCLAPPNATTATSPGRGAGATNPAPAAPVGAATLHDVSAPAPAGAPPDPDLGELRATG